MSNNEEHIILEPVLDIANATSFHERLERALADNPQLVLNGEGVERVTTPSIQLILAAALSLQEGGGRLLIENPSDVLKQAIEDLGLTSQLQCKGAS